MIKIIEGIMYGIYYGYLVKHTHSNRINLLNDWLNNPRYYNHVSDCILEADYGIYSYSFFLLK